MASRLPQLFHVATFHYPSLGNRVINLKTDDGHKIKIPKCPHHELKMKHLTRCAPTRLYYITAGVHKLKKVKVLTNPQQKLFAKQ